MKIKYVLTSFVLITLFSCHQEKCRAKKNDGCICPAVVDPVCGCDGVTYGNSCEAECVGITEYTRGVCQ